MSLSKKDLEILSKAASSLPRGAPGREMLASLTKKEASDNITPMTRNDHMNYPGSESWNQDTPQEQVPFIAELSGLTIPWAHVSKVVGKSHYIIEGMTPTDKWDAVLVGDSVGVYLSLTEDVSGEILEFQFEPSSEAVPEETSGLMKGAIRSLRSGKIPSWLKSL